jgi:hypothetical protein
MDAMHDQASCAWHSCSYNLEWLSQQFLCSMIVHTQH